MAELMTNNKENMERVGLPLAKSVCFDQNLYTDQHRLVYIHIRFTHGHLFETLQMILANAVGFDVEMIIMKGFDSCVISKHKVGPREAHCEPIKAH